MVVPNTNKVGCFWAIEAAAYKVVTQPLRHVGPVVHEKGIDCTARTRNDLQQADDFKPLYDEAKARVRRMEFRVVEIADPIEQTVFEVYAALRLPTIRPHGYNDFQNH